MIYINDNTKKELLPIPPFLVMGNSFESPFLCLSGKNSRISISMELIPGLSEIISCHDSLSFSLSFPFVDCSEFTINATSEGFSKLHIINEIRRAYRIMFRQKNIVSARWETEIHKGEVKSYLVAYPFSSIYVEAIYLLSDLNRLYVVCNGGPELQNFDSLPF